ncbi:MAG TPA: Rieske 2Fe-2S domain-containing protein [Ktedonobacteraceae bacterium]
MTTTAPSEKRAAWPETPPRKPLLRHLSGQVIESQTWLETLANPLQKWIQSLNSPGMRKLKDLLQGTWLGHPVHPIVTDIPIGSWTSTMLLDALSLVSENPGIEQAADATLLLGLFGSGASALTGLTDWSETDATDRRVGMAHGLLNGGALLSNILSYGLRRTGNRRAGIVAAGLGYTLTIAAAYLGGELSFAKGVGVNRLAWEGGSEDFVEVLDAEDLPTKKLTRVEADGIPVVLWKEKQKIYALAATCSHVGGPLDEGTCENGAINCPWHGSSFRLSDGAVVCGPAVYSQPTFAVRVRAGKIELRRLEHA